MALNLPESDRLAAECEATRLGYGSISDYFLALHRERMGAEGRDHQRDASKVDDASRAPAAPRRVYGEGLGAIYQGDSSELLQASLEPQSVDLIMTSPPFGLVRKKYYGNEDADRYLAWFKQFAEGFTRVLKPSGSLVIDIGGAWKRGQPTRSLYHFELLVMLCRKYGFHLAQEFYWWNPAKLPTPAEWVNVRRVRVKDAVNCIWWLSPTPYPKASNRRVLQPYSASQQHLFKNGYKAKLRPSGHNISDKFGRDNKGAIPPNLLALANTESNGAYQRYCRDNNLPEHPARFPAGIPAYFVRMLTDADDLVLDPFAGSCVTGEVCESLGRRWICCELDEGYVQGALSRFRATNDKLFSLPTHRTKPYEILPPNSLPVNEAKTPLVRDGGRSRPPATPPEEQKGPSIPAASEGL
ncbi:MAG: PvuII DNA methyltransferase [uncultured Chloroflexia bacterium]|uniref:Methyltransferase n=1 Tax=uncultured Chloroflexia bacterium TaxID=1672391 RepID=A0A6J4KD83_9CHLR|nr:MAG: PvuII DNA methyltransferase [uncultured Chloroflexia bacterium]